MQTSCFKNYKEKNGIAICLYPPSGWTGKIYKKLAPTERLFFDIKRQNITREEYIHRYNTEILDKLDPNEVYEELKDNVLLCWEPPDKFCHRQLVAEWIYKNLNIRISEYSRQDSLKNSTKTKKLF